MREALETAGFINVINVSEGFEGPLDDKQGLAALTKKSHPSTERVFPSPAGQRTRRPALSASQACLLSPADFCSRSHHVRTTDARRRRLRAWSERPLRWRPQAS